VGEFKITCAACEPQRREGVREKKRPSTSQDVRAKGLTANRGWMSRPASFKTKNGRDQGPAFLGRKNQFASGMKSKGKKGWNERPE